MDTAAYASLHALEVMYYMRIGRAFRALGYIPRMSRPARSVGKAWRAFTKKFQDKLCEVQEPGRRKSAPVMESLRLQVIRIVKLGQYQAPLDYTTPRIFGSKLLVFTPLQDAI